MPGAGLSRLNWELKLRKYAPCGIERACSMLLASDYIFEHLLRSERSGDDLPTRRSTPSGPRTSSVAPPTSGVRSSCPTGTRSRPPRGCLPRPSPRRPSRATSRAFSAQPSSAARGTRCSRAHVDASGDVIEAAEVTRRVLKPNGLWVCWPWSTMAPAAGIRRMARCASARTSSCSCGAPWFPNPRAAVPALRLHERPRVDAPDRLSRALLCRSSCGGRRVGRRAQQLIALLSNNDGIWGHRRGSCHRGASFCDVVVWLATGPCKQGIVERGHAAKDENGDTAQTAGDEGTGRQAGRKDEGTGRQAGRQADCMQVRNDTKNRQGSPPGRRC